MSFTERRRKQHECGECEPFRCDRCQLVPKSQTHIGIQCRECYLRICSYCHFDFGEDSDFEWQPLFDNARSGYTDRIIMKCPNCIDQAIKKAQRQQQIDEYREIEKKNYDDANAKHMNTSADGSI